MSYEAYDELQLYSQFLTSNILNFVAHSIISHEAYDASHYSQSLTSNILDFVAHSIISYEAYGASLYS